DSCPAHYEQGACASQEALDEKVRPSCRPACQVVNAPQYRCKNKRDGGGPQACFAEQLQEGQTGDALEHKRLGDQIDYGRCNDGCDRQTDQADEMEEDQAE